MLDNRTRWILGITLSVIVFLVTLLVLSYNENKVLEKANKELESKVEDYRLDNANLVLEKEMLTKDIKDLVNTLNNQTKLVKDLTRKFAEINFNIQ